MLSSIIIVFYPSPPYFVEAVSKWLGALLWPCEPCKGDVGTVSHGWNFMWILFEPQQIVALLRLKSTKVKQCMLKSDEWALLTCLTNLPKPSLLPLGHVFVISLLCWLHLFIHAMLTNQCRSSIVFQVLRLPDLGHPNWRAQLVKAVGVSYVLPQVASSSIPHPLLFEVLPWSLWPIVNAPDCCSWNLWVSHLKAMKLWFFTRIGCLSFVCCHTCGSGSDELWPDRTTWQIVESIVLQYVDL